MEDISDLSNYEFDTATLFYCNYCDIEKILKSDSHSSLYECEDCDNLICDQCIENLDDKYIGNLPLRDLQCCECCSFVCCECANYCKICAKKQGEINSVYCDSCKHKERCNHG